MTGRRLALDRDEKHGAETTGIEKSQEIDHKQLGLKKTSVEWKRLAWRGRHSHDIERLAWREGDRLGAKETG